MIVKQNDKNSNNKYKSLFTFIYVFGLMLTSCLLSTFKLYQYRINNEINFSKEFPLEIRDEQFCSHEMNHFQCRLFNVFKIVNRALNDILFLMLNILIDLIHKNLHFD